jgi:hypothetical protein
MERWTFISAALVGALGSACWSAGNSVRSRHAAEFDCPAPSVQVSNVEGDTYRAIGCGVSAIYVCVGDGEGYAGSDTGGTCVRDSPPTSTEPSPPPLVRAEVSAPRAPEQPRVTRTVDRDGPLIAANFDAGGGFTVFVQAQPTRFPGRLLWAFRHAREGTIDRSACPVRVMIDGELTDLGPPRYRQDGDSETLLIQTPAELAERVARSTRTIGRVCNEEFVIDGQDRATLTELGTRIREESAFAGASGPAHSAVPPSDGASAPASP